MSVRDFVYKYYVEPILYDTGYNPINTLTWAILLIIFIILLFRLLKRLDIMIDEKFVFANIPYVVGGGLLRVVEDSEIITSSFRYLLISPLIYFLVFFVAISILLISAYLRKFGLKYHIIYFSGGIIFTLIISSILIIREDVEHPAVLPGVIILASLATTIIYLALRNTYLMTNLNIMVIFAHMFDASATFVGIDFFNYWEKHVLPGFFINLTGTALVMYPLKIAVFIPLLYLLDREMKREDLELTNFIKFALITIGLAPGIRDAVRIFLGV